MSKWSQSAALVYPDNDDQNDQSLIEIPNLIKLKVQCRPDIQADLQVIENILKVSIPISPQQPTQPEGDNPIVFCTGLNEWLVVLHCANAKTLRSKLIEGLSLIYVITDLSDSLVAFELQGDKGHDILSEGCGVDLSEQAAVKGTYWLANLFNLSVIIHLATNLKSQNFRVYLDRSNLEYFVQFTESLPCSYSHNVGS